MIAEEIAATLASLQAEITELKRSVAELRALIPAAQDPTPRAPMSFDEAAEMVRSDYSHLLHKLSQ